MINEIIRSVKVLLFDFYRIEEAPIRIRKFDKIIKPHISNEVLFYSIEKIENATVSIKKTFAETICEKKYCYIDLHRLIDLFPIKSIKKHILRRLIEDIVDQSPIYIGDISLQGRYETTYIVIEFWAE